MSNKFVVTGAAGFIGSHVVEALLARGDNVIGVDSFTPYYDASQKRRNVRDSMSNPNFVLRETSIGEWKSERDLDGAAAVFHTAAQPGVRPSWGREFSDYVNHNILETKNLMDAVVAHAPGARVVYSSSSSVYGAARDFPTSEEAIPTPKSPYGVTKLSAEHLVSATAEQFGVSCVSLRYFTVYGPRQRPDMAFHRLFLSAIRGLPFPMYGDGTQIRDFTFVDDVVSANIAAGCNSSASLGRLILNIAGGSSISLADVIRAVEAITGRPVPVERRPSAPGDVHQTGGSTERAAKYLDWRPCVPMETGLSRQFEWHLERSMAAD